MLQIESERSFLETLEARLSHEIKKDERDLSREGKNPPWLILALANEYLDMGLVRHVLRELQDEAEAAMRKGLDYLGQLVEMTVEGDRHARTWLVARDAKLSMLIPLTLGDLQTARRYARKLEKLTIHRFKKAEAADLKTLISLILGQGDGGAEVAELDRLLTRYEDDESPEGQEVPGWRVADLRGWCRAYRGLIAGEAEEITKGLQTVLQVARERAEERIDANVRRFFHVQATGFMNLSTLNDVAVGLEAEEVPEAFLL